MKTVTMSQDVVASRQGLQSTDHNPVKNNQQRIMFKELEESMMTTTQNREPP